MYPLAMWLAANWWRLCWEPRRSEAQPEYEWRASHEWTAVGGGYLWPNICAASDGETVAIESRSTDLTAKQPVRYLVNAVRDVARSNFEGAVDAFVQMVLARLNDEHLRGTELEELWSDVSRERSTPGEAQGRRLEALLGCDADEAPIGTLAALIDLQSEAGAAATDELATALAGREVTRIVEQLRAATRNGAGCVTRLDAAMKRDLFASRSSAGNSGAVPWERGMAAARALRSRRGLGSDELQTSDLLALLGLNARVLEADSTLDWLPAGLAVRRDDQLRLLLRARDPRSRRFELARVMGDLAAAPESDQWHPVTRLKTARQKAQRAFAAELLCPVEGLSHFLGGDRSEDALDAAAEHFDVSTQVVQHQVGNHLDW